MEHVHPQLGVAVEGVLHRLEAVGYQHCWGEVAGVDRGAGVFALACGAAVPTLLL